MVLKKRTQTPLERAVAVLWSEALRPLALVVAFVFILAALIEGQRLEQFLYAIF